MSPHLPWPNIYDDSASETQERINQDMSNVVSGMHPLSSYLFFQQGRKTCLRLPSCLVHLQAIAWTRVSLEQQMTLDTHK